MGKLSDGKGGDLCQFEPTSGGTTLLFPLCCRSVPTRGNARRSVHETRQLISTLNPSPNSQTCQWKVYHHDHIEAPHQREASLGGRVSYEDPQRREESFLYHGRDCQIDTGEYMSVRTQPRRNANTIEARHTPPDLHSSQFVLDPEMHEREWAVQGT